MTTIIIGPSWALRTCAVAESLSWLNGRVEEADERWSNDLIDDDDDDDDDDCSFD